MEDKITKAFKEIIPYIIIILAVIIIRTYIITPVKVDGTSMYPTLSNNEILILKKYDKSYDRFDIVVFKRENSKLIKRIVGLPGDTIEYKNNKLYINGNYVKEDFEHENTDDFTYSTTIPDGYYYVLGDNRENSLDSRYFGPISKEDITGIVDLSIYPFKKIK